jgi:hypothetical protein
MDANLKNRSTKRMKFCPKIFTFEGTLEELYAYAEPNLPTREAVAHYHALLRDYCAAIGALYIVRHVSETERGQIHTTQSGHRFLAGDNAPVWWMHCAAFNDIQFTLEEFREIAPTLPAHFYQVSKSLSNHINAAGWYVAHIFPAKNGDTYYPGWDKEELTWRTIRNIHPCNQFYVPKIAGAKLGEEPQVIAYFAARYQQRYASIWSEFLALADVVPADASKLGKLPITINAPSPVPMDSGGKADSTAVASNKAIGDLPSVVYTASSLTFKFDQIEPIEMHESFRVLTKHGMFQMTKAAFYETFSNVASSNSYKNEGTYSYSKIPGKAEPYRMD